MTPGTARTNVLYVLNDPVGGATEGLLQLLAGLRESAYRAVVVVPDAPGPGPLARIQAVSDELHVVPMRWWNLSRSLPPWYRPLAWGRGSFRTAMHVRPVGSLTRLIRERDIDLVYTNTAMVLDGALAARRAGRPHLWHVKEWVGSSARTRFPLPDRALARLMTERLSDRLVAMTHFIAEPFVRLGRADRVEVVYDGVDADAFVSPSGVSELRARLGVRPEGVLVAMAASLRSPWKRHELFVDMAARLAPRLPGARFVIFGSVPERASNPAYNRAWSYHQRLVQRAHALGIGDRIDIGIFCPDVPQMMSAIDVLVHPCEIEPFGRVAIEAMAASRPVVGPSRGGISESVMDDQTGFLVAPGDVSAFAAATERLAVSPDLRMRFGAAGRARAQERFSLEDHVARFGRIYAELLGR